VLEELGTVMVKDIQDGQTAESSAPPNTVTPQQAVGVWESVLEGSLMAILQDSHSTNPVRASACDCVANIGNDVFVCLAVIYFIIIIIQGLIRVVSPRV
jgi:hypothetical protein